MDDRKIHDVRRGNRAKKKRFVSHTSVLWRPSWSCFPRRVVRSRSSCLSFVNPDENTDSYVSELVTRRIRGAKNRRRLIIARSDGNRTSYTRKFPFVRVFDGHTGRGDRMQRRRVCGRRRRHRRHRMPDNDRTTYVDTINDRMRGHDRLASVKRSEKCTTNRSFSGAPLGQDGDINRDLIPETRARVPTARG